jgi:hypothetical protein
MILLISTSHISWNGRHVPPCLAIGWDGTLKTFCLGWPGTKILLISASHVAWDKRRELLAPDSVCLLFKCKLTRWYLLIKHSNQLQTTATRLEWWKTKMLNQKNSTQQTIATTTKHFKTVRQSSELGHIHKPDPLGCNPPLQRSTLSCSRKGKDRGWHCTD